MISCVLALRLEAERIEVGVEVAAHPEGPDHHQGAQAVARGTAQLFVGDAALGFGLGLDLGRDHGIGWRAPIAVEGRDGLAIGQHRPTGALPGRALGALLDIAPLVVEAVEEGPPPVVDASGIPLVLRLKLLDVVGVGARQEARSEKSFVVPL